MCDEKGAVKFDDRADCLALGGKWFQDTYSISAKVESHRKEKDIFTNLVAALQNDSRRTMGRLIHRKGKLDGLADLANTGKVRKMRKLGRRITRGASGARI